MATTPDDDVPTHLSGRHGANRAAGPRRIAADDDAAAVACWLARYDDSPLTQTNYRKEVDRLMLWGRIERNKALSGLAHEDLADYQRFIADPQPRERWVMARGRRLARWAPGWRPFMGPLSAASQRQCLNILNGMFSWLVQAGYLASNPLALRRRTRAPAPTVMQRFLTPEQWHEVQGCIEGMPRRSDLDAAKAARARWLFSLLYLTGLRASEVRQLRMGDFYEVRDAAGRPRWWIHVLGKGNKPRQVPATDELLHELVRYRRQRLWPTMPGLEERPTRDETVPALMSLMGPPAGVSRSTVHDVVKRVMFDTAFQLRRRGLAFADAASHIEQASSHWMRHTAGSHMCESMPLTHVRDHLGHSSLATTSRYLHAEEDVRHDATNAAHRAGWQTP